MGLICMGCMVGEKVVVCFGWLIFEFGGNNVLIVMLLVDLDLMLCVVVFGVMGMVG